MDLCHKKNTRYAPTGQKQDNSDYKSIREMVVKCAGLELKIYFTVYKFYVQVHPVTVVNPLPIQPFPPMYFGVTV